MVQTRASYFVIAVSVSIPCRLSKKKIPSITCLFLWLFFHCVFGMQNRWSFTKIFGGPKDKGAAAPAMTKEEARRRLSSALQLMSDRPDGVGDISHCNLSAIPKDFFYICGTYVKTDVICSDNRIVDLESGGEIGHLRRVRSLHLERNRLAKLPLQFGDHFPSLVVLNLSDNCLVSLPASLGNLKSLKTLLLARNKLVEFPAAINQSKVRFHVKYLV